MVLKTPDFECGFKGKEKQYTVTSQLSVERYIALLKLEVEAGLSASYLETFEAFKEIYNLVNKPLPEPGRVAIIANNAMMGLENLDKKRIPGLYICALFINSEDEDIRYYDEAVMDKKIKDWQEEGYDVQSFLGFALSCIKGFRESYTAHIQKFSPTVENNPVELSSLQSGL